MEPLSQAYQSLEKVKFLGLRGKISLSILRTRLPQTKLGFIGDSGKTQKHKNTKTQKQKTKHSLPFFFSQNKLWSFSTTTTTTTHVHIFHVASPLSCSFLTGLLLRDFVPPASQNVAKEGKMVLINFSHLRKNATSELVKDVNSMMDLLAHLLKKGYTVTFHIAHSRDSAPTRRVVHAIKNNAKLAALLWKKIKVVWKVPTSELEYMFEMMKKATFAINFRYKAAVVSCAAGLPSINVGYATKVYELMDGGGLADYVLPIAEVSGAALIGKVGLLEENAAACQAKLNSYLDTVRANYDQRFKEFFATL